MSAHDIGGFQKTFSCNYICRFCKITYKTFRDILDTDKLNKIDNNLYKEEINKIESNNCILKSKCALSKLSYFKVHVSLPPDIMHDLLEGVIPVTLSKISFYFFNSKIIPLNSYLKKISFIENINKPNLFLKSIFINIKKMPKIIGSASQKLELFYIFPQLFDIDKVCEKDEWKIYLILREILYYLYAPTINNIILKHLSQLIKSFLINFSLCFGKYSLTPKFHFMLH